MEETMEGRVAVVTGASSGIGEATARELAGRGAKVALLARRRDRVEALATELGEDALALEADVTDRDSLARAAEAVGARLGRCDVLVNNAGVMLLSPFAEKLADEWRRMVETNLLGAMAATEAFLDGLRDGGGDVVNVSSVAGRFARPGSAGYSATKWGLNGWSEALRQELMRDRVRVTLIEPGAVHTELTDHITHEQTKAASKKMYEDVDALLAEDIGAAIGYCAAQPRRVAVNEMLIRPSQQAY